jgi:PQQ-dependent catabolism-associated CXXCW motif protein
MQTTSMLLTCVLSLFCFSSHSMTVETQGNIVFASGPVGDDLPKFEDAFAKGSIDTVVLVNSPGGDLSTGLRVGRLIAERGYKTVAAGSCVSACSIMFMGGKERRFSDAFRPNLTYIGIHGAHNRETKQVNTMLQPQIFAFYKQNMGDRFNSVVMNQALYDMEDADSLLRVFDPARNAKTDPYHCKSGQTPRDKCTKLVGTDALNLGVITHPDLVKLDLPVSFKTAPTILGKPLETLVPDLAAYYADLAGRQCVTDTCKTSMSALMTQTENRAVATPLQGPGRGASSNVDTPMAAVVRAIYGCNHMSGQPVRLCEPEVVNQYDIRPLYQAAKASHATAIANLSIPPEKFYANEEFGGGFTYANGLRTSVVNDITPQKIEGITTLGTQQLVRDLLSSKPPVLIDVIASFDTIPRAESLLNAGQALEDAAQDAALEKRIAALLALLAPDNSAPVVFFCSGRNCWLSVNAALRAKKLGYTRVQWYRGGIESWKAAGLPLATNVLRAVAR